MLHEFVDTNRDEIIARTRQRLKARPWPAVSQRELEHGVPRFLHQLADTLRLETTDAPFSSSAIGDSAAKHGGDLLALGFNVSQVVHDYGDICQAITELAVEQKAPITNEEFHTLNRCLDTAMAEAVTEHARLTSQSTSHAEVERLGQVAHELRNQLHTALLAFQTLKSGAVGISGNTGALLGRSLMGLRDLVESALTEVRLAAGEQRRDRISVQAFLDEIAVAAALHAEYRDVKFAVEPFDPGAHVKADPQLLSSAVMNLLQNAFKYTRAGGSVVLRAHRTDQRVVIEVEDECGGIPDTKGDLFQPFGERRGADRSGLGLGLSIARKAVRAHQGDIHIRNIPGKGCVFAVEFPLAAD